jgi:hypothetical protein
MSLSCGIRHLQYLISNLGSLVSYDLSVWTIDEASLSELLLQSAGWNHRGRSWVYQAVNWGVVVYCSERALREDLPADVARSMPGTRYLTNLSLSPIGSSVEIAHSRLLPEFPKVISIQRALAEDRRVGAERIRSGAKLPPQPGTTRISPEPPSRER